MTGPEDGWVRGEKLEAVLSEALFYGAEALLEARWDPMSESGWSQPRPVRGRRRRRTGWTVFAAVVIVLAGAATAVAIVVRTHPGNHHAAGAPATSGPKTTSGQPSAGGTAVSSSTGRAAPPAVTRRVRVTTQESDGTVYGIGVPIVVYFPPAPRDVSAFKRHTTVTVDGPPAGGSWYWVEPTADQKRQHQLE